MKYKLGHLKDYQVAIFLALLVGLLPFYWAVLRGFVWETNDDPAILWLLSREGYNWSPYQGQLLCGLLKVFYRLFPNVEWWVVTNIVTICVSSVVCFYILYRRVSSQWKQILLSLILFFALWGASLRVMNFTRTAMIVAVAGGLLVVQGVCEKSGKMLSRIELIAGILLLLHGTMIRYQCAIIALAFLGLVGAAVLLNDQFCWKKEWFFPIGKKSSVWHWPLLPFWQRLDLTILRCPMKKTVCTMQYCPFRF